MFSLAGGVNKLFFSEVRKVLFFFDLWQSCGSGWRLTGIGSDPEGKQDPDLLHGTISLKLIIAIDFVGIWNPSAQD